jgi:hypothetical protein
MMAINAFLNIINLNFRILFYLLFNLQLYVSSRNYRRIYVLTPLILVIDKNSDSTDPLEFLMIAYI